MDLNKQINLLASAIENLEVSLFLETIQRDFLSLQGLTMGDLDKALEMSKLKIKVTEAQIKYYKVRLEKLEKEKKDENSNNSEGR